MSRQQRARQIQSARADDNCGVRTHPKVARARPKKDFGTSNICQSRIVREAENANLFLLSLEQICPCSPPFSNEDKRNRRANQQSPFHEKNHVPLKCRCNLRYSRYSLLRLDNFCRCKSLPSIQCGKDSVCLDETVIRTTLRLGLLWRAHARLLSRPWQGKKNLSSLVPPALLLQSIPHAGRGGNAPGYRKARSDVHIDGRPWHGNTGP